MWTNRFDKILIRYIKVITTAKGSCAYYVNELGIIKYKSEIDPKSRVKKKIAVERQKTCDVYVMQQSVYQQRIAGNVHEDASMMSASWCATRNPFKRHSTSSE